MKDNKNNMEKVIQLAKEIVKVLESAKVTDFEKSAAIDLAKTLNNFEIGQRTIKALRLYEGVQLEGQSAFLGSQ